MAPGSGPRGTVPRSMQNADASTGALPGRRSKHATHRAAAPPVDRILLRHGHRPCAIQQRGFGHRRRCARAGGAGRRHGWLQRRRDRLRHGHGLHSHRARALAAGSRRLGHRPRGAARDGHLRGQRQPRDLQCRQCQSAVRRHGHHAGGGGVPRHAGADRPCGRLACLPHARRAADADDARPFAAAGADRRRPDHP